eukprot:scaffold169_cov149-Ochromonas_danica.AAC.3
MRRPTARRRPTLRGRRCSARRAARGGRPWRGRCWIRRLRVIHPCIREEASTILQDVFLQVCWEGLAVRVMRR